MDNSLQLILAIKLNNLKWEEFNLIHKHIIKNILNESRYRLSDNQNKFLEDKPISNIIIMLLFIEELIKKNNEELNKYLFDCLKYL